MAPPLISPMLAGYGRPAGGLEGWAAEVKLDGWRAQVAIDPELPVGFRVTTRAGCSITDHLGELAPLTAVPHRLVLDGELCAGDGSCASFYGIAPSLARRRRTETLTFAAFDLLWLDGQDATVLPYSGRRRLLEELELPSPAVVVCAFDGVDLETLLDVCETQGVEGVVLKHQDAPYLPGRRSTTWRKVKCPSWQVHRERRRPRR